MKQYLDANVIAELVHSRKIGVISVEKRRVRFPVSLDKGETEAILLTRQMGDAILVTDDGKAIKACRFLKIPFIISPKVVIALYRSPLRDGLASPKIFQKYFPGEDFNLIFSLAWPPQKAARFGRKGKIYDSLIHVILNISFYLSCQQKSTFPLKPPKV